MFRSSLILGVFALVTECGGGTPSTVTFCERLQSRSASVQTALAACSGSGDDNIYGFSRTSCDAKAETACTEGEKASLLAVGDCEAKIKVCVTSSDRSRVVNAIQACAGTTSIGSECIKAISP